LLTLMLLVGLILSVRKRTRRAALTAIGLGVLYVGIAAVQQDRASDAQKEIATSRGHAIVRGEIFPTVGNPFIWRSLYESGGMLYTDRVRVMSGTQWKAGHEVELLEASILPSDMQTNPRIAEDFVRFRYFSAGWVARAMSDPSIIGDARYSLSTERFEPIWGLRFHPQAVHSTEQATEWVDRTAQNRIPASALWAEISGGAEGYGPLPAALPTETATGI
jgi:inner membrane protein